MRLPRFCSVVPSDATSPRRRKPGNCGGRRCFSASCFCSCSCEESEGREQRAPVGEETQTPPADGPRLFSYAELYHGSGGFSEVLGSGGFGRVYRAVLPSDGSVVAVKHVSGRGGESESPEKSFLAELAAVARLRHRNLVRLRGWCVHHHILLLVYDYMPNRSLDRLLFGRSGEPLRWDQRRRIVAGLAAALHYLHEQLDTQIIHRDVKASNVLLDSSYHARLGDFGLARWLEHDSTPGVSRRSTTCAENYFRLTNNSRISGTMGYLPPESFPGKGTVTAKSDVFSFGIVALELATGRRVIDLTCPDDEIILLDWMRQVSDEGHYSVAIDRRLPEETSGEVQRLMQIGLLCSLHDPQARPSMKWVVEVLSDRWADLPSLPTFKNQPNYYLSFSSSRTSISSSDLSTTTATLSPSRRLQALPTFDAPREITLEEIAAIADVHG